MKKFLCSIMDIDDNLLEYLNKYCFSIKPERLESEYFTIELKTGISMIEKFEKVKKQNEKKNYIGNKGLPAFSIVKANELGIGLYEVPFTVGKELFLFIPWGNISCIHNYSDEELCQMEKDIEKLPYNFGK